VPKNVRKLCFSVRWQQRSRQKEQSSSALQGLDTLPSHSRLMAIVTAATPHSASFSTAWLPQAFVRKAATLQREMGAEARASSGARSTTRRTASRKSTTSEGCSAWPTVEKTQTRLRCAQQRPWEIERMTTGV